MVRDRNYYEEEYLNKKRSPKEIAEEFGTYPNKIRRELVKLGFKLRDKSEAQQLALKSGRHTHPTKGKKHSLETKESISDSMASSWSNMSSAEKERRSKLSAKQWKQMDKDERAEFRRLAVVGLRKAAIHGSKLELYLYEMLSELFSVDFHVELIFDTERTHADLYVKDGKVIIEVDGPSHYEPIWGQETLKRNQLADAANNKTLMERGYNIIRVKHLVKTVSDSYKRKLLGMLIEEINQLINDEATGKLISVEVM